MACRSWTSDRVLHRLGAKLVRGAVDHAALDPAPGHPDRETPAVVVPAWIVVAVAVLGRLASELAAPDDQRGVEHSPLLEVGHQGRERLVDFARLLGEPFLQVLVMVPAVVPHLHESHTALDKAARDEQLPARRGAP